MMTPEEVDAARDLIEDMIYAEDLKQTKHVDQAIEAVDSLVGEISQLRRNVDDSEKHLEDARQEIQHLYSQVHTLQTLNLDGYCPRHNQRNCVICNAEDDMDIVIEKALPRWDHWHPFNQSGRKQIEKAAPSLSQEAASATVVPAPRSQDGFASQRKPTMIPADWLTCVDCDYSGPVDAFVRLKDRTNPETLDVFCPFCQSTNIHN